MEQLSQLLKGVRTAGVNATRFVIDLSIARGLDYYTGTILETFLLSLPEIGSVCSGGRYDNLASLYTKQRLPGIGASLGLDRLLAAMEELNLIDKVGTPAPVFLAYFDRDRLGEYLAFAGHLRRAGVGRRALSGAKETRAATQVRRSTRFSRGDHCRSAGIRSGDLPS